MMALFFAKEGKHIVCGGTTSSLAAKYLGKPVDTVLDYLDPEIPPTAKIEGVDLVTEGVITISRVLTYAKATWKATSCIPTGALSSTALPKYPSCCLKKQPILIFMLGAQ